MVFKNSAAIIRTKKDSVVRAYLITTYRYKKLSLNEFINENYIGDSFELYETVGGSIIITVTDHLIHSEITFKNVIQIDNVTDIEIMSIHNN